jgi:integrase
MKQSNPKLNTVAQAAKTATGNRTNFNFTEATLAKLHGPGPNSPRKSIEYSDTAVSGLKAEFGRSGRGTYRYRYSWKDGKRAMRIGTVGATSLADARKKALEARADLDRGIDPQEARDQIKAMPTFEEFALGAYMEWSRSAKRSNRDDASRLKHHLIPRWGKRRLCDISRRDVDMLKIESLRARAPATTNRLLALTSSIYRQALNWGVVDTNPVTGVKMAKESKGNERYLSADEAGRFLAALETEQNRTAAAALTLLAYTGCRCQEILRLRWSEVRVDDAVMRLVETKNGDTRYVQLSREAIELLRAQPSQGLSPWVFPGRDGPARPIVNVRKTMLRALKAGGIVDHARIHDIRHSVGAAAVQAGVPLFTVQNMLGHKSIKMTQRYAHMNDQTARAGSQAVGDAMANALKAAKAVNAENHAQPEDDDGAQEA